MISNLEDSTEMANLINESVPNETDLLNSPKRTVSNQPYNSISATNVRPIVDNQTSLPEVAVTNPRRIRLPAAAAATTTGTNQLPNNDENEEEEEEIVLKYGASHVIKLFIPVTICLLFVIISLSLIKSYQQSGGQNLIYTPFDESQTSNGGTKLWMSIANASIFISVVIVMTIVLILLYKFKCYKIIHGWLAFSSLMLLFFFTYMFISELFKQFNLVTDMITVSIFLWNFGVIGMFCIHWKGPLFLQQVFLIFSCIQMALIFIKYLPEWTTWVLLALISVWDLIAVLCPFGPLRILVETARSRNDQLFPAMVYSSTILYTIMAGLGDEQTETRNETVALETTDTNQNRNQAVVADEDDGGFNDPANHLPKKKRTTNNESNVRNNVHHNQLPVNTSNIQEELVQQQDDEENGVKLGLGDFIFYSILVGKASILGDWNTVIACFVAILIGLCLTLVLLAVYHKPLPALPISLMFGLIFYFLTNLVVRPFYENLTFKQVFI